MFYGTLWILVLYYTIAVQSSEDKILKVKLSWYACSVCMTKSVNDIIVILFNCIKNKKNVMAPCRTFK